MIAQASTKQLLDDSKYASARIYSIRVRITDRIHVASITGEYRTWLSKGQSITIETSLRVLAYRCDGEDAASLLKRCSSRQSRSALPNQCNSPERIIVCRRKLC
jgi:hypothetical protein